MPIDVDYESLRSQMGFTWVVRPTESCLRELSGVAVRDFYLDVDACVTAHRTGREVLRERFGDDITLPSPGTPILDCGHVNCLGAELTFPDDGEVVYSHPFSSLEDALSALDIDVDFASAGQAKFYMEFYLAMQGAFPDELVSFNFGKTGPITTAYALRGHDVFMDILVDEDMAIMFMQKVMASILQFNRFRCRMFYRPSIQADPVRMYDDMACMISPAQWPVFVLPFWDSYYMGHTTGLRKLHAEGLRPDHVALLEQAGIGVFEPGFSTDLDPQSISANTPVPFEWLLPSAQFLAADQTDIRDFVFQAAVDGASSACLPVEAGMCDDTSTDKVRTFIDAGKQAATLLSSGTSRRELAEQVSSTGKAKLWSQWP